MKISRWLVGGALGVGVAHLAAKAMTENLKRMPDPFQSEELFHPTPGDADWVVRDDGTRLRVRSAGDGSPVILAHGHGLSSQVWSVLAERLIARGHRVITFDQRGHGESSVGADGVASSPMAGDYAAVLDHFSVSGGILVGHSMGSFLALKYLLDHPEHANEHLSGVVLTAPIYGEGLAQARLLKQPVVTSIIAHPVYGTASLINSFGTASPALVGALQAELSKADFARIAPAVDMVIGEDLSPRIVEIGLPIVVISGSRDRIAPPAQARLIATNLLHGELVLLEGAGHMLNWEAIDEIVRRVEERIAAS